VKKAMIDTSPESLPATELDVPTRVHRSSWGIVIDGCLLVLLAAVLVFHAKAEETGFISFIGILSIIGGVLLGIRLWMASRLNLHAIYWAVTAVPILVGLALLIWPEQSLDVMIYAVAITLLVRGIVECTLALSNKERPGWELLMAHGALGIILGIVFFIWPLLAPVVVILFLGVDLVVRGALQVSLTAQIRKKMDDSGLA